MPTERLTDIIRLMLHDGRPERRTLSRGLILSYRPPNDPTDPDAVYTFTCARPHAYPSDEELKIVHDCLTKAWRKHPPHVIYNVSPDWRTTTTNDGRAHYGCKIRHWKQYPIRDVLIAPPELQPILHAALNRR